MSIVGKLAWTAAAVGATAFAVQGGEYATTDLWRQRAREHALVASVDALQRAVDSLRILERRLRTDPVLQETVAREEFGMVRGERELLYRFTDPAPGGVAAAHAQRDFGGVDGRGSRDTLLSTTTRGWSSLVARRAHNPKVAGSNPAPAMRTGRLPSRPVRFVRTKSRQERGAGLPDGRVAQLVRAHDS